MEAIKYNWSVCGDTITVINVSHGTAHHVSRKNRYADQLLQKLLAGEPWPAVALMFDRIKALEAQIQSISYTIGSDQLVVNNRGGNITVTYNNEVLGGSVVDKIIQFMDWSLPVDPLAKFILRLMKNPSFNSRKQLYDFLAALDMTITPEGTFIAYKGVTADFKDCHTKTFNNAPGAQNEMPRANVDDNPENHCSKGFHVGAWPYASTFGAKTVMVEVDPADVVSVPSDHNAQKCRVTKYKVLAEVERPVEKPLYDPRKCEGCDGCDDDDDDDLALCPNCGGDNVVLSNDRTVGLCKDLNCTTLFFCVACDEEVGSGMSYCPGCGERLDFEGAN